MKPFETDTDYMTINLWWFWKIRLLLAFCCHMKSDQCFPLFVLGSYALHFVAWIGYGFNREECSDTWHGRRRGKFKSGLGVIHIWLGKVRYTCPHTETLFLHCSESWLLCGFRLLRGNVRFSRQSAKYGAAGALCVGPSPWENHTQQRMMWTQTIVCQKHGQER